MSGPSGTINVPLHSCLSPGGRGRLRRSRSRVRGPPVPQTSRLHLPPLPWRERPAWPEALPKARPGEGGLNPPLRRNDTQRPSHVLPVPRVIPAPAGIQARLCPTAKRRPARQRRPLGGFRRPKPSGFLPPQAAPHLYCPWGGNVPGATMCPSPSFGLHVRVSPLRLPCFGLSKRFL